MMKTMRALAGSALLLLLSGCAHATETHESTMTVVSAPPSSPSREVIAVDEQAPAYEAPRPRPRLTQTITLGQANNEATYSAAPPAPAQGQQGAAQNVTINNNVVVQQQPPMIYGGYGSYGYGYGYGGGRSVGVRADGFGGRGFSSGQWGSSGWEGSRRTAAPGATPGVGGNWAPAPSYGPSQMK